MATTAPRLNSPILGLTLALAAALMVLVGAVTFARAFTMSPADVFINEIHYDNDSTDANEAIEIAGPAGTNLSGWTLVLYNGANGQSYNVRALSGVISDLQNGFGTLLFTYPVNGIQNGSPDGVALVNGDTLVQFLSYEGSFTAVGGPADGVASTDIGVTETGSEPVGQSLQLRGSGSIYQDFTWAGPSPLSPGAVNAGQTFQLSANALIVTTCPTELITTAGTPAMAEISATDSDSTVNSGAITNGGAVGITLDGFIPAPSDGGMAEATLQVSDAVEAGIYPVTITFGNDDGQSASCTVAIMVSGPPTPIYAIQGVTSDLSTLTSPLEGDLVTTEGVVTVVLANGFFIQDPIGDGDVATSDGLFVFTGSLPTVSPGDLVRVSGTVIEFRRNDRPNDLTLTQISNPGRQVSVIGSAPQPTPVAIDAPDELINPEGIVYWERLEGMYVELDRPVVVGSTARVPASSPGLTEFYVVAGPDAVPGSGFRPSGNILVRDLPGDDVDYNPERVLVDDESRIGGGNNTRIVEADAEPFQVAVAVGDAFTRLTGVIDYQFGQYRRQPDVDPESLLASRQGKPGVGIDRVRVTKNSEVSIASFNVENFFDAVDDPDKADSPILTAEEIEIKAAKLTLAIADELRCPDILVLVEIEEALVINGDADGHVPGTEVIALVPRLAARGCPYSAVSREASDDRSIEVGFMYRTDRDITLKSYYLTTEGDADTQEKADENHVFDGQGDFPDSREPLVGEFEIKKRPFIVIGNHWNSKGGNDALYGATQPPVRSTEEQRKLQATYLREYLDQLVFAADTKAAVVVAGDLNDFPFPEPGEGVDPLTILKGSGSTRLTNLIERVPERERYTFIFEGNSQVLDYLLVSEALLDAVEGIDIAAFNASYGTLYEADISTTASSSDHNPPVIWLKQSKIKKK
jgi:predicted extracellular nuclease